ncbi:MAG: enoyl-CoA hydratase/isomerase family protein, partial [Chloroflexota bacterium]
TSLSSDGIYTVTFNRPDVLNAVNDEMRHEFRALGEQIWLDDAIRAVIFTGAGRAFSAGADMAYLEREWSTPAFRAHTRILTSFFDDLETVEKPIIAAINGPSAGAGFQLALSCDIRFAAQSAQFGLRETNIGLVPAVGACSRLARIIGYGRTKELIFSADMISAEEAHRIGLVYKVVPDGELMSAATEFAQRLLTRAPQAIGLGKRILRECLSADLTTGRGIESLALSMLTQTDDLKEGVRAFREKRKPNFKGK